MIFKQNQIANKLNEEPARPVDPSLMPRLSPNNNINKNPIKAINNNNGPIRAVKSPIIKTPAASSFQRRKEEYAKNKARGQGLLNNPLLVRPPLAKKTPEFEYEEKLRKIREKNYNNRKAVPSNSRSKDNSEEMRAQSPAKSISKQDFNSFFQDNRLRRIAALKV